MTQATLFENHAKKTYKRPVFHAQESHRVAAERYLDEHPDLWDALKKFALEAASAGKSFGMKAVVERIRWEMHIKMSGKEQWKLNNSHTSYWARKLIQQYPMLERFIELRKVRS